MDTSIAGSGKLRIEAEDACEVFLDGEPVATLESGDVETLELLADSYVVTAERKDGSRWEEKIQIQIGAQSNVTITFEEGIDSFSESERVIIRPGQQENQEGSQQQRWTWTWAALAILCVGGIAVYGFRPQWTRSVSDYARKVVRTLRNTDKITTAEDTPVKVQVADTSKTLLAVTVLTRPSHGTLKFSPDSTSVTYAPAPDFSGTDQFRYVVRYKQRADSVKNTVDIRAVPDPPHAQDDEVTIRAGDTTALDVLANDISPDELPLHIEKTDTTSSGTLVINEDSTRVTYTPTKGFFGVDSVEYVVADSRGATDEGLVTIKVKEPPPTPSDLDVEWKYIEAGSFIMGSDKGPANARPSHRVKITTPFRISATEVTVRQFRMFVEATGYRTDAERKGGAWRAGDSLRTPGVTWKNPGFKQSPNHPVVCVSWRDARAFADWMGGRLPTEAEWEYAARAGVSLPKLPGEWKATTWYAKNANGRTHPVGQKEPNNWGLHDVQGNVWEWVQDWYAPNYYEKSPPVDPQGPDSGKLRVCRGGSWHDKTCYLPTRNRASPTYSANNIGFRIVKPVRDTPPS